MPTRILFVCLGNICRSPTAEGVFRHHAPEDLEIRSGGTAGYHVGEPPDPRTQRHALRRGYDLSAQRAHHVKPEDLAWADHVLAMDRNNLEALRKLAAPADLPKIRLFLDFAPDQPTREVPDPYYGGHEGFEEVIDLCESASRGLLEHLQSSKP
jgi:protein-tyrosine phosphatase